MDCTASHTVTQADLDAGHYANEACVDDGPGGATQACDDVDTPGENNPSLSIIKVATEDGFSAVGDVIHYTITATNTGNVTLHNVDVTDSQVSDLVCVPTVPVADLGPGEQIDCTASHTIDQGDLDAGSFYNQACVDDGQGGAAQACDDVTTNGGQSPDLTITKDATESGYDAVGDVIHYTITATNTGNVTLHNVDVTDNQVSDLVCDPTIPVTDLAPGGTITCTASHTITQLDLDAGSFYNQACVDDGQGGAAEACDDVTTTGEQNPDLTIVKNATEDSFGAVGDVIHYSITATNTGNVTLHNVDVTDPEVSDLACLPATPVSSLAPGDSITCTASHTITQLDLDAGSVFNEACVDDGEGGATEACDDVTTNGEQNPELSITKAVTEAGFTAIGQVLHYTIVATNTGNVTLHDVVVTDPNAANLVCDPSLPVADLAPGDEIDCTADHTVTADDATAGFYDNEACVDDGDGPAAEACADVRSPGQIVGGATDVPTLPNTASAPGGGSSGPTSESWLLVLGLGILAAVVLTLTPRPRRRRA
ncbi:MAG: DUF11 domain-containing protein [Chloroflexi bacterium]|nr:DUF11 domain-containing protein [Chloroflexota bacterium]